MHVTIPKAVFWNPSNTFHAEYEKSRDLVAPRRWHKWLARIEDIQSEWEDTSYFVEHRRKNFSDVCHAKLSLGVDSPLPGTGYWWCSPSDYPPTPTGAQFTIASSVYDADGTAGGGFVSNDYANYAAWGNGAFHISVEVRCFFGWDQFYRSHNRQKFQIEVSIWARSTVQPQNRNQLYYYTTGGKFTTECVKNKPGIVADSSTGVFKSSTGSKWRQVAEAWVNPYLNNEESYHNHSALGLELMQSLCVDWFQDNVDSIFPRSKTLTHRSTIEDVQSPHLGENSFLLHEPGAIMYNMDDILYGNGTEHYWRNVATQHAYLDALRHVPKLNDNMVSNILEISSFIKALVVDRRVEVPKSLGQAWLAYRYSYGTTKADAREAISFVHRHMDLGDWTMLKTYGRYVFDYKDVQVTCRCELEVYPKALSTVQKVWKALYTYGLSPSFYMVWDMIPYSFIVDWFLPIGDVMAAWDAEREYSMAYDLRNVNYSLTYDHEVDGFPIHCYTRWYSSIPDPLRGYYFFESDPSTKTVVKRVLDAGSLILG